MQPYFGMTFSCE